MLIFISLACLAARKDMEAGNLRQSTRGFWRDSRCLLTCDFVMRGLDFSMVNRIITDSRSAFAPATVANIGPGFDVLGFALGEIGDRVHVDIDEKVGEVVMRSVTGDEGAFVHEAQ